VLTRYLANKTRHLLFNNFFLNAACALIRPFYPLLRKVIKPREKIFTNSEQDIIRFVKNLATENILEEKEANLVQAALNFDDLRVSMVYTSYHRTIFLVKGMEREEIQEVYSKHFFNCYPVLNKKKEVIGIFNFKLFYRSSCKKKNLL
jgi:CBS domain containing-hemolysin-like protein